MDNIRALVLNELNLIEDNFYRLTKQNNAVFNDLGDFLLGKSKRIRSLVSLLYLKANNINTGQKIIDLLFSVELIHNASLLHDDVIDNSPLRRNVQTLFDKYGSKLSVISGDYILSIAVEKLLKLNNECILNLFLNTVKKMSEAEILQFFSRNQDITLKKYLDIVCGKTSSLFSASMKSAAILSGIDADRAGYFGDKFGMLFQINNDLDSSSAENDMKNGVKTAVNILGIEKTLALKDNYKEELRQILAEIPDNKYKNGIEDLIELL